MSRDHTFCRICEAACGLKVVRDSEGAVTGLRPDRNHPLSRGFVCAKGTRFLEVAQHSSRVLEPLVGGQPASWRRALQRVGGDLRRIIDEHGPHAVGIYFGNPLAFNALGLVATIALANQIGTRNLYYAGSQDCNNKFAAADLVYGSQFVHPIPDFARTELAVVFGSNPYISQSSFVHLEGGSASAFGGIIKRGGTVYWIDPRRTESAQRWGTHVAIRPGADAWLMLGLLGLLGDQAPTHANVAGINALLDRANRIPLSEVSKRTGIAVAEITALADRIRKSQSAVFHMSVGVNQSGHGTLCYALVQALSFVTGNLDQAGGVVFSGVVDAVDKLARMGGLDRVYESRVGGFKSVLRTLPGGILADEITREGPGRIRALLVIAGDPVRSIPGSAKLDQALRSLDLLACIDMFKGKTGQRADVMLPAASWLERWDVAAPSIPFTHAPLMQVSGRVLESPGSVRTDAEIVSGIARATGLRGLAWRAGAGGLDRWLPAPKYGIPVPGSKPGRFLRRHRVKLWGPELAAELERLQSTAEADVDKFTLIGRRRRLGHNSWLHGGVREAEVRPVAWMSEVDGERLGVRSGDSVRLTTLAATREIEVELRADVGPRTLVVPHGLVDFNVNALIPSGEDHIERISGQHVMTGVAVDVQPVSLMEQKPVVSG